MSNSKRIAALAAVSLLALGACASDGPRGRGGRGGPGGGGGFRGGGGMEGKVARPVALFFVGLDTDHDLRTSQAELAAAIKPEWARMDKDKSGSATAFEVAEWGEAVMGASDALPNRVSFDTDMSGLVSFEEFAQGLQREFDRLDTNHDGFLDRKELVSQAPQQSYGPGGDNGGGQQGGGGGRGPGGGGGGRGRRGGGGY